MIRELKQTLTQEMTKILDRLNNGYTIDFTGIVDKIYYINSIIFNGIESPITNATTEEMCVPLPPPIVEPPTPPEPILTIPTVVTTSLVATSNTTITSGGTIMSEGNTAVTQKGVCWVQNTNPTLQPTIDDDLTVDGTGASTYVSNITNLIAGTSYHIRAYAINSVGVAYGNKLTITTLTNVALPIVTTSSASVTNSTIDTGGEVTDEGSSDVTARGVCISVFQNPTLTDLKSSNGSGIGVFVSNFSGLAIGTTYYLRAYATNSVGTAYGNQVIASTTSAAATITTTTISSWSTTYASGGGDISSDGGSPVTSRGVCWSTSSSPTVLGSKTTDGAGIGHYMSLLTGLTPGTLYYVRAYAINGQGPTYGNQVSFTTNANLPTVTTTAVTGITLSGAVSGGNITSDGGAPVTERGVYWDTTGNPNRFDPGVVSGSGTGSFSSILGPLVENTTYYIRAYAYNSAGWGYGDLISFSTLAILATLTTSTATSITTTSASITGNITFTGPGTIAERGICYNTFTAPTIDGPNIITGDTNPFTASLTGLQPNSTYYARAYVIYDGSPIYGNQVAFVTLTSGVVPVVPTPNIVNIVSKNTVAISVASNTVLQTGGASIDEVGFVIKAGSDPTIADGKVQVTTTNVPISYIFTGLTPGVSYYIKAYAHNSAGYGLGVTTIQATDAVVVTTVPSVTITNVEKTSSTIKVRGTITNTGNSAVTDVSFGRKTSSGVLITDDPIVSVLGGNLFEATYYSLTPATNYYFKAFATNSVGVGESADLMITTNVLLPNPTVITNTSYISTTTELTVGLEIYGGDPSAVIPLQGFYWSESVFNESEFNEGWVDNYMAEGLTSYTITGLTPNTTYFVRAVANVSSPTPDIVVGQQIAMDTLNDNPGTNTLKSMSVGSTVGRLTYEIWLSNDTLDTIFYRLRVKNVTKGGDWVTGPQMPIAAEVINQLVSYEATNIGVSNSSGDSIEILLSNTDGSTWDAVLETTSPITLPYSI